MKNNVVEMASNGVERLTPQNVTGIFNHRFRLKHSPPADSIKERKKALNRKAMITC